MNSNTTFVKVKLRIAGIKDDFWDIFKYNIC